MSWKSEFPDYDGEFHKLDGWSDNSWHNDTCPHIEKRAKHCGTEIQFCIWQDYVDVDKREVYDQLKRFLFHIYVDGNLVFNSESDDWADMENLAKGVDLYGWEEEL